MDDQAGPRSAADPSEGYVNGEGDVWSIIGSLVAGPLVWGGAGYAIDAWQGTDGLMTGLGILFGFAISMFIVYVRHIRE